MSNFLRPGQGRTLEGYKRQLLHYLVTKILQMLLYTIYCYSLHARNSFSHPIRSLPMPETARQPSPSLVTAPVIRAYTVLRAIWDYYAPPTWLLLYYPLLYLAKVAKRLSVLKSGRETHSRLDVKLAPIKGQGLSWILAHVGIETATTIMSAAILGLLIYVLLLRCGLLGRDFWKATQSVEMEMEDPRSLAHEVPERLLHTSVEIGLDKHEVIVRQKAYGTNELRPPRSWIFAGMRLLIGPANLLLEVSTAQGLHMKLLLRLVGCCFTRNSVP